MKYFPAEIAIKRFDRKMMGYDAEQVEAYLAALAGQMEAFLQENESLKAALRNKELDLIQLRQKEELLQSTMTQAAQASDRMREEAERQARIILKEAEEKAETITSSAKNSLKKIYEDISDLRKSKMQFEANLKAMMQAHLSLLEQGETFMPKMRIPNLDME